MRRSVLLLVLAVGLVAAFWRWQPADDTGPGAGTPVTNEGGYVASDALLVDTGDDGNARFRLHALSIAQAGPGSEVQLEEPRLEYEGSTRWQLAAHAGSLPEDATRVSLSGNVDARAEHAHEPPLRIRTESLDIDLVARRADTPAPVEVELGGSRLAAVGLHADMKTDVLRLESRVHGEYAR